MADPEVYLYVPPTWRSVAMMGRALRYGVRTSTVVYRLGGVWHNIHSAGIDDPVVANVDIDALTGMRLFFTKPMVVPGHLYDELAAIQPADPSWLPGSLTLL